MTVPFAMAYLAGAILSTVLPLGLAIAMAWWYFHSARRLPAPGKNGNGSSAQPAQSAHREEGSPAAPGDQAPEAG